MFPTIVPMQREVDLHERTPFRALRFADEIHAGFSGSAVGLACVAHDAGADDVLPRRWSATVARNNVVEIQILSVENLAAILAGVFIALKNVVPGEFHFFFRQPVIHKQQNNSRHADAERNRVNGFIVWRISGKITPFGKIERAERTVRVFGDDLCLALKEKRERAAGRANIDSLP